jgi:chromosome segregation ATPase
MVKLELSAEEVTDDLDAWRNLTARLGYLKTPTDICLVENKALRADVNKYLLKLAPVFVDVQCPDPDDAPKNPVQIVVKEINAEILELLEVHISPDGIAELEAERNNKLQELRDFMARLEAFEQSKASPQEIQAQINKNTSLEQTIDEIEARSLSLENEIRDLNGVLVDNAGMIEGIDILNQRLVELSAEKDSRQSVLDEAKSTALAAQAVISQRDLEISKLEAQISDLDIQMEAASSTAGNLVEEVVQLGQDIAERTERVATLEASVSEAQSFVDNANDAIGQKSQEVSKLDVELSKKVADATILANSVSKLVPQADAAETTVEDMLNSLKTKFVPIGQYEDQATRLNELTQAVTERTKLIQELRSDLASIEQEEQLFIKMCLADAQCKAAMGERLGVDQ